MSFLGDIGHGLKSLGEAALAAPGAVYDTATYVLPGNQWGSGDDSFGNLLDSLGGHVLDVADPLGLGYDKQVASAFNNTMSGLSWAYHEGVDQPLSTAWIMADRAGFGPRDLNPLYAINDALHADYSSLTNGDNWSKAYQVAENQSIGQSAINAATDQFGDHADPLSYAGKTQKIQNKDGSTSEIPLTPFMDSDFTKSHPFLAQATAFGLDLAASWYLDPAVLAGKGLGAYNEVKGLGKINEATRATYGDKLDGASAALDRSALSKAFKPTNPDQRVQSFIDFAHDKNLNGAEVRAIFPEFKNSTSGRQLSTLAADATKISDPIERGNAVRRVLAVGAGDVSQISRLDGEVAAAKPIADQLSNIVRQRTVDLQAQALAKGMADNPQFRLAFNKQLENLDANGDLSSFIKDWHGDLSKQLADDGILKDAAGGLDYTPAANALTGRRLAAARGNGVLDKVEGAHDKVFERLNRFGHSDGYNTVYQRGLSSVPLIVSYPAKLMAKTLPTKLGPSFIRGLKTVHLNGFVNTHDWDGAVDQLDSMMKLGGVQNEDRLNMLSEAMRFGTGQEAQKQGMIERVEHATVNALASRLTEKFGVNIDSEFIKQSMLEGQKTRASQLGALTGGRQYATTSMQAGRLVDDETALRFKGEQARRQANGLDQAVADERADILGSPRVDLFHDATGAPIALPMVTSQLANRIPLFDIERANKLASDAAYVKRLSQHSEMYQDAASELTGLQAKLMRAKGSQAERVKRDIENVRKTQDWVLDTASAFSHTWKMSVLFRLGYPMRVLADDHLRIASRFGYMQFLGANVPEAVSNSLYNHLPGGMARMTGQQTRKAEAKLAYQHAIQQRSEKRLLLGRDTAHSDEEWQTLKDASKTWADDTSSAGDKMAALEQIQRLDPSGYVSEYYELQSQAKRLQRTIGGHKGSISRWQNADDAEMHADKITAAQQRILETQGDLDNVLMQLDGASDPEQLRQELSVLQSALRGGEKNFLPEKRALGTQSVLLGDGKRARGAFDPSARAYYEATSSQANFNAVVSDGEESLYNAISSGHWRTITPNDYGYYQVWANILNHQMQHSPEYMSIVKGGVKTPEEYAKWLAKPENAHIRDRVPHYAADPEDWGGRLLAVVQDYMPTQQLQDLVAAGRVSPKQLKKLFPENVDRPNLHGQLADVQSGRVYGARALAQGVNNMFRYLSEVPTDQLSRHPYFNAVYKREVKAAAAGRIAAKGDKFVQADVDDIERLARKRAMAELKNTLWDVSSHSHAAHTLRFVSPFFAAHQEAMTRWWGLAKDKPQIVRQWQLAFDAPRKAGLETDADGNPVEPGAAITSGNQIMLKVPFAGDNSWVNKTLRDIGGGKNWSINENGLNIVLQSGIANPGVGPLVTIPIEGFVQKYAESDRLEKAARVLNAYPPTSSGFFGIAKEQLTPSWAKRLVATATGSENQEFVNSYTRNLSDGLVQWNLAHPGDSPSRQEVKDIKNRASDLAHRDLMLMSVSNLFGFTPAKPDSKYAVVQDGLNRLRQQMESGGHDFEWLRTNFEQKYGEAYMSMLYSKGTNNAGLDGTKGEIVSMKAHRALLDNLTNPLLTRMVVGPDADALAKQDPALGTQSDAVRGYLRGQKLTPTSDKTYMGSKSLDDITQDMVAQQGWDQYDQLTNYLQTQADQKGLLSYEQDPDLVAQKRAGLSYIKAQNPTFADVWDAFSPASYDSQVDDMRSIASDPSLNSDPLRSNDVYWLGQYIGLRDSITAELNKRIAAGGAKTITASPDGANADLARLMRSGTDYIISQSPNFLRFDYHGIIERDPYLTLPSEYDNQEVQ